MVTLLELKGADRIAMTVYVDTLKLATRLEAGGFTADQAKTVASVLGEAAETSDLVTKVDIAELATKADLNEFKLTTAAEFRDVKTEIAALRLDIATVRTELKAEIRTENKLLEQRMTIRLGTMLVVMSGILMTGLRFMLH